MTCGTDRETAFADQGLRSGAVYLYDVPLTVMETGANRFEWLSSEAGRHRLCTGSGSLLPHPGPRLHGPCLCPYDSFRARRALTSSSRVTVLHLGFAGTTRGRRINGPIPSFLWAPMGHTD
jgi:hypothetical protein